MKIKVVNKGIADNNGIFYISDGAFDIEFSSYFESRICNLFNILSNIDFDEVSKCIKEKSEAIMIGNESINNDGVSYSIDINKEDYKLKIKISNPVDTFYLIYNEGYKVKITAKKKSMYKRLLEYKDINIIDVDGYGIFIDTVCEDGPLHQYIKGFKSKNSIIANLKTLPFKALNIQVLSSSMCFVYGGDAFYEIRQKLKKLTQKEKEENTIIGYDGTEEINLYTLCNNLIMLGYENSRALKLSKIDKSLEPCRFQGLSDGMVVLSTSRTVIYDIYLED